MVGLPRAALACAIASLALAEPAFAVPVQGTLGPTSTGSIDIEASIPGLVQVSSLRDVNFDIVDPSVTATDAQNICVFSNTPTRGYNITATGDGAANAFTLANAAAATIAYSVEFADTTDQTTGDVLAPGTPLTGQTTTAISIACLVVPLAAASLIVSITPEEQQKMVGGQSYTGTLTLLVAPE